VGSFIDTLATSAPHKQAKAPLLVAQQANCARPGGHEDSKTAANESADIMRHVAALDAVAQKLPEAHFPGEHGGAFLCRLLEVFLRPLVPVATLLT
jgi:hypothetical protein